VEADLNLEFEAPLDYKEVPLKKTQSKLKVEEEQKAIKHAETEEYDSKFTRIDGKKLTKK